VPRKKNPAAKPGRIMREARNGLLAAAGGAALALLAAALAAGAARRAAAFGLAAAGFAAPARLPVLLLPDVLPRLPLEEDDFELPDFMVNAPWTVLRQARTCAASPL
jgi:hypothetical protein